MNEQITKDRQLLLIYSLLWLASTLWVMRYYPLIKSFDLSVLSRVQINILFIVSITNLLGLIMTSTYVYRMYSWLNLPNVRPGVMTTLFVILSLLLGLVSFIIIMFIFWKSKKLLLDTKEESD